MPKNESSPYFSNYHFKSFLTTHQYIKNNTLRLTKKCATKQEENYVEQ